MMKKQSFKEQIKLKQSEIETIKAAFRNYDEDESGYIDVKEFQNLVEDLNGRMEKEEYEEALDILDKNQNGVIEEEEFIQWWSRRSADIDGDGEIDDIEKTLCRLKEYGQERFHVDIHTAVWNGHLDVVKRCLEDDPSCASEKDQTEYGVG